MGHTTERGISRWEDREKLGIKEIPQHFLKPLDRQRDFLLMTDSHEVRLAYERMINPKKI